MKKILVFAALAAVLGALPGCRTRTFVLVTVDADPQLAPSIDQIRFVSRLSRGGSELTTDERQVDPPSPFPGTFIVLADDRGQEGDQVEVLIEGLDAAGEVVARGRATAPIIADDESTDDLPLRILLAP